ncbi:MAG: tetratricopeptide repeat protein [Thermoplasmata archaeon]|nr:MAG: tetratricopeptide repeat protein [Thermoplasmata archaeon]
MAKPKLKLKLTIEERILLHIRNYFKYEHNLQAPFALTQDGIAKAVSVVRSAIPRSMKKLEDKNLVKEQISHVEGVSRRRKIYFLTTEGLMRAQEITEKLEQVKINVKNQSGEIKELKFSEINKFLGTSFSYLEILEGVNEDGMFDYPHFVAVKSEKVDETATGKEYLAFTDRAPKISYFIGREDELNELKSWMDGPDHKVIVVHGIAGMGKTTLAVKIMDEYRVQKHIVWYSFHQWDTLRYFVRNLASFIAQLGRRELQRYIDSETIMDMNIVGEMIETALSDQNVLIVIDDLHKARDEILPIFSLLIEILERLDKTKLLIFSRHIVPFYDRRHVKVKKLVGELHLQGLTKKAAKELLKHRGMEDANVDSVYKLTAGHPLSIELLEQSGESPGAAAVEDLNKYIQEEIFSKVSEFEKRLLAYASVYRYGVPKDILLEEAEGGFETLKDLTARTLLETRDGIYSVHDLIREFFYETQPLSIRKMYHRKAAQYYLEKIHELVEVVPVSNKVNLQMDLQQSPDSFVPEARIQILAGKEDSELGLTIIEGLYHLIYSERFPEAGVLAAQHGERLLAMDRGEELKELLEELPEGELEGQIRAIIQLIISEIYNQHRDFESARERYIKALESFRLVHGESTDPGRMALIHRRLGFIYERSNDWEAAKTHHKKSLELAEKANDALAISDAYGALGWLYWSLGEHERADEYYDKCIGMADSIADMPGKAKVYLGICMALAKKGELEEALKYYENCLDILERNEDIFKLARSYEGMGDHYLRSIFSHFLQREEEEDK